MVTEEQFAALQAQVDNNANGVDIAFIIVCSALVILMQVGFAYVESGNVRVKNVRSILLKNMADYVIGGLIYYLVGGGISTGASWFGILGTDAYAGVVPESYKGKEALFLAETLFGALFACTTSTIISGAIAERLKLSAYIVLSVIAPIVLYGLPAHWVFNSDGFLKTGFGVFDKIGFVDFAGGAVVHVSGGVAAFVAAWFVGPRIGRYRPRSGYARDIPGHSFVLAGLGTWLILFGWIGFNAGSSLGVSDPEAALLASQAALNTFVAVAAAAMTSIVFHVLTSGKMDLGEVFNAMLAGAAGVTAGCAYMEAWFAIVNGIITTVVYMFLSVFISKRLRVDDPVNAIAVHFGAAQTGTILLGFFHNSRGLIYTGEGWLLLGQLVGSVVIILNAVFWTGLTLFIYTMIVGVVRVDERVEIRGCDIELDGMAAYENTEDVHMQFLTIRENPKLYEELRTYLKSIYCYENIRFLEAVEAYEAGWVEMGRKFDAKKVANEIYQSFLSPDSTSTVNLPDWQVKQVERIIKDTMGSKLKERSSGKNAKQNEDEIEMMHLEQEKARLSERDLLRTMFAMPKAEIINLLDNTIRIHFRKTPQYQDFTSRIRKTTKLPLLHCIRRAPCCTSGKRIRYGRPRPFDPFKKFTHTARMVDEDEDDGDGGSTPNSRMDSQKATSQTRGQSHHMQSESGIPRSTSRNVSGRALSDSETEMTMTESF